MWIDRHFKVPDRALPIKVLKGPRQVGKTSTLERLGTHHPVYLDDIATRTQAQENPRFFLDQLPRKILLDEATLAPNLFPELKRRIDEQRRGDRDKAVPDIWITGSNQTLLRTTVGESLAGRASYFDLNTLSVSELGERYTLREFLFRGGWPELYVTKKISPINYLNDLITTFIERDIVSAAGIEKKGAFLKTLQLISGRVGQLMNYSELATIVGVDLTTIQSWVQILQENGVLRILQPYHSNLSKRLIKSPKIYFEDVALATRLQGWTEYQPLSLSPLVGSLFENIVVSEFARYFINRGEQPRLNFIRSRDQVEIDLIVHLPNMRALIVEIKTTPVDLTIQQRKMIELVESNVIERWIVGPTTAPPVPHAKIVPLPEVTHQLDLFVG